MKKLNALIIGFGSIGRKHYQILKKMNIFKNIYVLTNQKKYNNKFLADTRYIDNINPSYIIISSKTNEHYSHLKSLEKKFKNKKILVEKPLFHKFYDYKVKNNKVFIGYNLRFHPVLNFIKNFLKKKNLVFSVSITCKSYLPDWRKNLHYSLSNSAKKSFGGGALLELSHEIDYFQWLFGKINKIEFVKVKKVTNFKIDCEDSALIVGKSKKINFFMNLDFHSKIPEREINICGKNFYIKGDLLNYKIEIAQTNKPKIIKFFKKIDQSYIEQHKAILINSYKKVCSYKEGKEVMKLIELIKIKK